MLFLRRTILVFAMMHAVSAHAEVYRGIGPLDSLSDLKEKFPAANFKKLSPAWAQEHDVLYEITGRGLSGTIIVKFLDSRPAWRKKAAEVSDPEEKASYETLANQPDDSISVEWVRWVPDQAVPLQRFVSKYGTPNEKGFADEDLQPYRQWTAKGLTAFLTDDEKLVSRVDFSFTIADECAAYKEQGWIPPWLQDQCNPRKPGPKASGKKSPQRQ